VTDLAVGDVPVQALFQGDFLTFLVVFEDTDTIAEACERVAEAVVGKRIARRPGATYVMTVDGQEMPGHLTVAESPIVAESYVVVAFRD
jgi:hypothetical protein